jgi:hypothetical protein
MRKTIDLRGDKEKQKLNAERARDTRGTLKSDWFLCVSGFSHSFDDTHGIGRHSGGPNTMPEFLEPFQRPEVG